MRVGELAAQTGVTVRALRYYEAAGLVVPRRLDNGYREYDPLAVRLVEQIRLLTALGLTVEQTRPFVECLTDGHDSGDVCPASLAAYQQAITELQDRIVRLTGQRDTLITHFDQAAAQVPPAEVVASRITETVDPATLPGRALPDAEFAVTDGSRIRLDRLGGRSVLFVYPLTGRPGVDLPAGWAELPGARGCTAQVRGFRDHYPQLREAGTERVYGLSAQTRGYQRELVHRLHLPYAMIADPRLDLAAALGLPTFTTAGLTLYERLTLVLTDGVIDHVFHPITAPVDHAAEVAAWLLDNPLEENRDRP